MKLYLFDVDGVLCDTGCKIDPEFQSWFIDWSKNNQYALVTGGTRTGTLEQIGEEIVRNAYMSFHCIPLNRLECPQSVFHSLVSG